MGQTDKPAERVICADPDAWYRTPPPEAMGAGNHAELWEALRDPAVVHGMCEDYRAGLRIDREHEEADRAAGRRVPARRSSSRPRTTTSTSTATRPPSGAPGSPGRYAPASSTPATTRPRMRPPK